MLTPFQKRKLEHKFYLLDVDGNGVLEADDFEQAVRNAISLGGDADTQACIAGGIAEAYYGGVPPAIQREVKARLPEDLLGILEDFLSRPRRLPRR